MRHAHKNKDNRKQIKTTENKQRQQNMKGYEQVAICDCASSLSCCSAWPWPKLMYKQVAICTPSCQCCSSWPRPEQWAVCTFRVTHVEKSCLLCHISAAFVFGFAVFGSYIWRVALSNNWDFTPTCFVATPFWYSGWSSQTKPIDILKCVQFAKIQRIIAD